MTGPNGTSVVIPAGALTTETRIHIEQTDAGAPAMPGGFTVAGLTFEFTPHGTTFAVPATVTLPFDPALVPAGVMPELYKSNAQNQWEQVASARYSPTTVSAQVSSFSVLRVVYPPLSVVRVVRAWSLRDYRGAQLEENEVAGGTDTDDVDAAVDFGPADLDQGYYAYFNGAEARVPPDSLAVGLLTSIRSGKTYWVATEAPKGDGAIAGQPIASRSRLVQYQTFIKNTDDASYSFTISAAHIEAFDGNGILGRVCPTGLRRNLSDPNLVTCALQNATIDLEVTAYPLDPPSTTFFRVGGFAVIYGSANRYSQEISPTSRSRAPLWNEANFTKTSEYFESSTIGHYKLQLNRNITHTIDLSSVQTGHTFIVKTETNAYTSDRSAGVVSGIGAEYQTASHAWLRDPATIGGTAVVTTGLTPVDTSMPVLEPVDEPVTPAPCVPGPGPNPAAGTLQFSAPTYTQAEADGVPTVTVTRIGGSTGAVTATFSTANGTAIAGADYTTTRSSVFFADGDATARAMTVPITQDSTHSEPDKTVMLALSEPGGCAALGAQVAAVLTITDDDPLPPAQFFTVGGAVTGMNTGNRIMLENHYGVFLEVTANGPFTFSWLPSPTGTAYFVRVFSQPRNALGFQTQQCTVQNGTGTIGNANVTNIVVNCVDL